MSRSPLPSWPAGRRLRDWQTRALAALDAHPEVNFLASATPAAGKTTFGLRAAHDALTRGEVERVVVIAPTAHIARQWSADAARYGIDLEPNRPNGAGREPSDRHGVAVTYQAVAAAPRHHARACGARPTLVIADEPHHMGEHAAWGTRTQAAFADARARLLLSGTPFRSDGAAIPWVVYDDEGISHADFTYTYTQALLERVCRPITFLTYDGEMEWVSGGRRRRADFAVVLPAQEAARRLRTALDPAGDWIGEVLQDADARLGEVRATGHRDAGGLVVAADKEHAAALAARLAALTGEPPPIVTSDDPRASELISAFAAGTERWLVSVLMVSEGVDIPRLRVGVYATAARTELFFRQVVGRLVRRSAGPRAQMSYLFLPSDPVLRSLAARIEEERRHALAEGAEAEDGVEQVERALPGEGDRFVALSSSARPDEQIVSTVAPGENLSLFADPAPPPSRHLAAFAVEGAGRVAIPTSAPTRAGQSRREQLRSERGALVAALARRTGETHGAIHARANRATGSRSVAGATLEQLERGNAFLAQLGGT